MEIIFVLLLFVLEFVAPVVLVIGLVWGVWVLFKGYKEGRSFRASRGNAAEMSMQWDRVKSRLLTVLGFLLWPVAFVAALYYDAGFQTAVLIACACTLACWIWAGYIKARYNASFKENIVKAELSKVFDNLQYNPAGKFDAASVCGFFEHVDAVGGNDMITADYKGIHFSQCDLKVAEEYTVTTSDGKGGTTEEIRQENVFRGRAMRFDFADKFRGEVQVIKKDFSGAMVSSSRGDWQSVETELAEFNAHFETFARDPLDAMAVLTPQMIEGIFYLHRVLGVPMAFHFNGNVMLAFLTLSRDAFDVSGNAKKTLLEEKELLQKDIKLVTGFLDTMYFKRQEAGESAGEPRAENQNRPRRPAADSLAPAAGVFGGGLPLPASVNYKLGNFFRTIKKRPSLILFAVYLVSAVNTFIKYPTVIPLPMSSSGSAQDVPTLGFLAISSFFVCIPLLSRGIQAKLAAIVAFLVYLMFAW
jgi:hypothetical protein